MDLSKRSHDVFNLTDILESSNDTCLLSRLKDCPCDQLIQWKHPHFAINIFQYAILHGQSNNVKYLANLYPPFITDRSLYKISSDLTNLEPNTQNRVSQADDGTHDLINSPLQLACIAGSIDSTKFIINANNCFNLAELSYIDVIFEKTPSNKEKIIRKIPLANVTKANCLKCCILSENIDFIIYFIVAFIPRTVLLNYLYVEEPPILQVACAMGCRPLVQILLDKYPLDINVTDQRFGRTPLHLAVWNGDTETIKLLLERGADVNVVTNSRGCLHILYRSKLQPANYIANTKELLKYRINISLTDENKETVLMVILQELFMSHNTSSILHSRAEALSKLTMCKINWPTDYNDATIQQDLLVCLGILLEEHVIRSSMSDDGILKLLQTVNTFSCRSLPQSLDEWHTLEYKIIEVILRYDANKVTFSHFAHNTLNQRDKMLNEYLPLFVRYGIDFDKYFTKKCSIFKMIHLRKMNICNVKFICDAMSFRHLNDVLTDFTDNFCHRNLLYGVRSLMHICKVSIIKQLHTPIIDVVLLPLPNSLKDYLLSKRF